MYIMLGCLLGPFCYAKYDNQNSHHNCENLFAKSYDYVWSNA